MRGRIRSEIKRASLIAKRIEQDLDPIVGVQRSVTHHLRANHTIGFGIVGVDANVQVVGVAEQHPLRALCGRPPRIGLALHQFADSRRRPPHVFVQQPVDDHRARDACHLGGPRRIAGDILLLRVHV